MCQQHLSLRFTILQDPTRRDRCKYQKTKRTKLKHLLLLTGLLLGLSHASFAQNLLYWTNVGTNSIGRANLDGTVPNQNFITGAATPGGIAANATHIYWANAQDMQMGRANADGTGMPPNLSRRSGAFGWPISERLPFRDALMRDGIAIANDAQQWKLKPEYMGGSPAISRMP